MGSKGGKKRACASVRAFLELLEAFKCDFKKILIGELGGVVHNIDPEKRNNRHLDGGVGSNGKSASNDAFRDGKIGKPQERRKVGGCKIACAQSWSLQFGEGGNAFTSGAVCFGFRFDKLLGIESSRGVRCATGGRGF